MPNMSYCRFQNTLPDLKDCHDAMGETDDLSLDEARSRLWVIRWCVEIARDYGHEVGATLNEHDLSNIQFDDEVLRLELRRLREAAKDWEAP
jgi:hypothetical protein